MTILATLYVAVLFAPVFHDCIVNTTHYKRGVSVSVSSNLFSRTKPVFRLGLGYLQSLFLEWNVDCEYNRKGLGVKELDGIRECSEQRTTDRVFPDIIIHERNTNDNLLVVEIKTISPETICDARKLELFTADGGEYKYKLGLYIKFQKSDEPILEWYKTGKKQ